MSASGFTDTNAYLVQMQVADIGTLTEPFDVCRVRVEMNQALPSLSIFSGLVGGSFGTVPVAAMAEMRTESQTTTTP
jgi:hypothetical protein